MRQSYQLILNDLLFIPYFISIARPGGEVMRRVNIFQKIVGFILRKKELYLPLRGEIFMYGHYEIFL